MGKEWRSKLYSRVQPIVQLYAKEADDVQPVLQARKHPYIHDLIIMFDPYF